MYSIWKIVFISHVYYHKEVYVTIKYFTYCVNFIIGHFIGKHLSGIDVTDKIIRIKICWLKNKHKRQSSVSGTLLGSMQKTLIKTNTTPTLENQVKEPYFKKKIHWYFVFKE